MQSPCPGLHSGFVGKTVVADEEVAAAVEGLRTVTDMQRPHPPVGVENEWRVGPAGIRELVLGLDADHPATQSGEVDEVSQSVRDDEACGVSPVVMGGSDDRAARISDDVATV